MNLETGNRAFVTLATGAVVAALAILVAACASLGLVVGALVTSTLTLADTIPAFVFLVPVAAGLVAGTWSLRVQIRATKGLTDRIAGSRSTSWPEIDAAARRSALGGRVDVVEASEPFAFTYGLTRPRVVVSTAFAAAPEDEVEAVLIHEQYHVANLDPLKVLVARTVSRTLFFLPALSSLHRRYVTGRELAADRRAIEVCGSTSLATALYHAVAAPRWPELAMAAAIAAPDLLDARVTQLETGCEPEIPRVSRAAIGLTVASAGLLAWASVASMLAMPRMMSATGVTGMEGMSGMSMLGAVWTALLVALGVSTGWWIHRRLRRARTT